MRPIEVESVDFAGTLVRTTGEIRRSLAEALSAAGCEDVSPSAVSRRLGLHKSLAWKACRMVLDSDPLTVTERMPGREGVRLLSDAMRARGASAEQIEAFQVAVERLRGVTLHHAGDRETLAAMVSGLGRPQAEREVTLRRSAFIGNSAIWGVRARVHIASQFVVPSATPGMIDHAVATVLVDFQRLRQNVPWDIASIMRTDDRGAVRELMHGPRPIDEAALAEHGAPLMPEFCTSPLPPTRQVVAMNGVRRLVLGDGPVGRAGSVTVATGWKYIGDVSGYQTEDDRFGSYYVTLSTPVETLIADLFVHRDLPFALPAETFLMSLLPASPNFSRDGDNALRLPSGEKPVALGMPPDTTLAEFPAYHAMARTAAASLGADLSDFVGYRVRLRYPPIPAMLCMRHPLLTREG